MEQKLKRKKISIFWFRRDLRLTDNRALYEALKADLPVLPIFIFDTNIIDELPKNDSRISFIYNLLNSIATQLKQYACSIYCKKGTLKNVWKELLIKYDIQAVYANEDYEPYAIKRDNEIKNFLQKESIPFYLFKDQVIFAKDEILKKDGSPYTVFSAYKNKWLQHLANNPISDYPLHKTDNFLREEIYFPSLSELGFSKSLQKVKPYNLDYLDNYANIRDFPALDQTSKLSPYLRFGAVSIRKILSETKKNPIFVSELIWREFFMQILYHFPKVISHNFKSKYDKVEWRNNSDEFEKWKNGETGYPLVDAGMHELNTTGYMHNRVRMLVASFLCKHLLIDWRWGEAYFAEKLIDYELSSNNGNWQWAASTGCDAVPYFRIFNPWEQSRKFDPQMQYIKKWIPNFDPSNYMAPIVEHKFARERALNTYKSALQN